MSDYNNGAITALAYMAEQGASKEQVFSVAEIMNVTFDDIDESDHERLIAAYGYMIPALYDCKANTILLVIASNGKYLQFDKDDIRNLSHDEENVYYESSWQKKYNQTLPSCVEIYAAENTLPFAIDHEEYPLISSGELTWCNEVCDDGNALTLDLLWDLKIALNWTLANPVDENNSGWNWLKERYKDDDLDGTLLIVKRTLKMAPLNKELV